MLCVESHAETHGQMLVHTVGTHHERDAVMEVESRHLALAVLAILAAAVGLIALPGLMS